MKNSYYFLFYCFYILDRLVKPQWWGEYKAVFWLCIIDSWIVLTLYGFLRLLTDSEILDSDTEKIASKISLLILIVLNWFFFLKGNKWKKIVAQYDKRPVEENNKKYVFVSLAIGGIVSLFAMMLYFTGKKNGNL